jgi:DNA-binding transcriptional MerR regulator
MRHLRPRSCDAPASPASAIRGLAVAGTAVSPYLSVSTEARMAETRLSFKEMCARFEVTPRTLRYYEYIELLRPEKVGRARFYGPREIARMTLILRGRRFGFSLEEIRQWLEIYQKQGTDAQMAAWIALADRQLGVLAAQKADLEAAIDDLKSLRDQVAAERARGAGSG